MELDCSQWWAVGAAPCARGTHLVPPDAAGLQEAMPEGLHGPQPPRRQHWLARAQLLVLEPAAPQRAELLQPQPLVGGVLGHGVATATPLPEARPCRVLGAEGGRATMTPQARARRQEPEAEVGLGHRRPLSLGGGACAELRRRPTGWRERSPWCPEAGAQPRPCRVPGGRRRWGGLLLLVRKMLGWGLLASSCARLPYGGL